MKTAKQRKRERQEFLFRKHFFSKHRVRFIKDLPCEVTGELNCVNAHMKSRGSGGDYTDIVPLSWGCHTDFDEMPMEKFEKKYGRTKNSVRRTSWYYKKLWEVEMRLRQKSGEKWR
jgi:hypothetical protein